MFILLLLRVGIGRRRGSRSGTGKDGTSPKETAARSFTFRELATATKNFKEVNLIGEGGFGKVYKGRLESGEASQYFYGAYYFGYNSERLLP